jgi:4-hydroxy-tetrahydrodipicolinate reductase
MSERIGVAGVTGQVGRLLAEELEKSSATLTGGTLGRNTQKTPPAGVRIYPSVEELAADSDAVIDFTHASTIFSFGEQVVRGKAAWIIGTSGLTAAHWDVLREAAKTVPVLYASSFAATSVLMPDLVATLARLLPAEEYDTEIIEAHHKYKVDAPSGTATTLGRLICETRGLNFDEMAVLGRKGETGPRKVGSIGFGAIRAGEIVGETKIYFMSDDETIILDRRVFDRRVYAVGAIQAARWAIGKPAGLYSMKDVLGQS